MNRYGGKIPFREIGRIIREIVSVQIDDGIVRIVDLDPILPLPKSVAQARPVSDQNFIQLQWNESVWKIPRIGRISSFGNLECVIEAVAISIFERGIGDVAIVRRKLIGIIDSLTVRVRQERIRSVHIDLIVIVEHVAIRVG